MWKPDESLDDFIVKAAPDEIQEPPRSVSVRFTGEVEVIKPLARFERPAPPEEAAAVFHASPRLSWFHRSLAVGGALAVIALILTSAIIIGMYDPPVEESDDVALASYPVDDSTERQPDGRQLPVEEPLSSDIFSNPGDAAEADSAPAPRRFRSNRFELARSAFRISRSFTAGVRKPRTTVRSSLFVSTFSPTTLVIFIENGVIKSRIEPWLAAAKKPQGSTN